MGKKGFTLLELIVVILIVGVLASLALPRLFRTIEFSRSAEAWAAFSTIRSGLERCYLMNNGSYTNCNMSWDALAIENPANSPNAHFMYFFVSNNTDWLMAAIRNTRDNGEGVDAATGTANGIGMCSTDDGSGRILKYGSGVFRSIGTPGGCAISFPFPIP